MLMIRLSLGSAGILLGMILLLALGIGMTRLASGFDPAGTTFPTHAVIPGRVWRLEIAHTDALRTLGLGERDTLSEKQGMLFLFDTPRRYGFWMKGMRFPLDIIFLSQGQIIAIERRVQPDDARVLTPPGPINQVLEVNAGEAAGLSVGNRIWYWRSF